MAYITPKYELDHIEKQIICSKTFLREAGYINEDAYRILVQLRHDHPDYEVVPRGQERSYETHSFMRGDNEHFAGVYFVGDSSYNPLTRNPEFHVKVGEADDVAKRMKNYCTHNPSVWHNGCALDMSKNPRMISFAENNAHKFIESLAMRRSPNTGEWYNVTEEIYMALCEAFQSKHFFECVVDSRRHGDAMKILNDILAQQKR